MIARFGLLLFIVAFSSQNFMPRVFAQSYEEAPSPDDARNAEKLKDDAMTGTKTGQELLTQAEEIMKQRTITRANLADAIRLYAQAGQRFEKAHQAFNILGTTYVTRDDIEGAERATRKCVDKIKELKGRLNDMSQY